MAKTKIKGLENFDKLERVLRDGMSRSLKLSGLLVKGQAQKKFKALPGLQVRTSKKTGERYYYYPGRVPGRQPHIRSGRLRGSIVTFPESPTDWVVVGTNISYSSFLEVGTSTQRARPFLRPAVLESKKAIQNIFRNVMGKGIKVGIKV